MSFNLILFKLMLLLGLSSTWATDISSKDNVESEAQNVADLQTSATSAKLLNLGSLFGAGNTGSYPNNNYRPGCAPCYDSNALGCYCSGIGKYPANYYPNNNNYYPTRNYYPYNSHYYPHNRYYPNNNFYPSNYYPTSLMGTNILGAGYGGYGGYGGNGGLRQYSGYYDPQYVGQRNLGYAYYTNTNNYGLPKVTGDRYGSRGYD